MTKLSKQDRNKIYQIALEMIKCSTHHIGLCYFISMAVEYIYSLEKRDYICSFEGMSKERLDQINAIILDFDGDFDDIRPYRNYFESYPEINRHKPRHDEAVWYPYNMEGTVKRTAILKKAVKLTSSE